jgi:hypothetical protein
MRHNDLIRRMALWGLLMPLLAACAAIGPTPDGPAPDDYEIGARPHVRADLILQVEAGQSLDFYAQIGDGTETRPEPLEADWSVEPADGASIDAEGVLTTAADLPHGTVLTVTAWTRGGYVSDDVYVYRREANPLIGAWREVERIECETGQRFEPRQQLREVLFLADGRVYVTTDPFEDFFFGYEGRYALDPDAGTFTIADAREINETPSGVDQPIPFEIDALGRLVLPETVLTTSAEGDTVFGAYGTTERRPGCGHVLERLS